MNKRNLFIGAGAVVVIGLLTVISATRWSDARAGAHPQASAASAEMIARGAYLARVGDCAACHSVQGQPPYSGGLRMETPIGAIYTSNITPDRQHGIGNYTLADFDRALRYGVANGHTLYPAMPYSAYSSTTPEDVAALYAYFTREVRPAAVPRRENEIPFPLSMRWPLTIWRLAFAPEPRAFQLKTDDAMLRRGAYIVEGLGHCGDCHTPRGPALQVRALGAAGGPAYLSGAMIDGWHAPSLRNGDSTTIGAWSEADIAQFLRTGTNRHGIAFASMNEVIANSTQFLSAEDAAAAAHFLKSLTDPTSGKGAYAYDPAVSQSLRNGDASARGAQLYLDNCAACHRPDGKGYEGVFPALAGNPVVTAAPPDSVIRIILEGMTTARTAGTPAQFSMPSFARRLSDQEVADVATFVRDSWGNRGAPVAATDVKRRATAREEAKP
ncbi:c-type cytochrome [Pseudoduganella sp. FT25W]|uniref:C-type cytochrome n=1 Tax=Duganella alba TaxID=2666081 RepID=A0A6L5QK78_9BURK|nr:cytochrome c [Duganella alba]MRX10119.1 c-type cytochrome [Duganella alba]MRX16693.1 c-type cytochrome [Duganella alba]